ncbi:MAG: GTPase ObgE [Bacteroidia bacterium]|nr:MAG: GTPase ObgE [Bacteroidia bacterium]
MLIDNVNIKVKAGKGGNGAVSFIRNGQTSKGGPDGGNGGNGGDIFFQGSTNINDLKDFAFKKEIIGENGIDGARNNLFGKNASHKTVLLPIGTIVTDLDNGKSFEIRNDSSVLVAKGGKGGRGNNEFKTATKQSPKYAEYGQLGQEKNLNLELKFIAEIGLIGLPNAGKSSLLAQLTNANPKIGDYPFTTLEPNIGVLDGHLIADIPGLIEGASEGKGLGIKFLKHIEKTKLLIHCISSTEVDPLKTYQTVRGEFEKYNAQLLDKPEIILLTKTDLITPEEINEKLKILKKLKKEITTVSIYDQDSLKRLTQVINSSFS